MKIKNCLITTTLPWISTLCLVRPHLSAGSFLVGMPFLWVLIPFMLLICIISFSVIGSFIWLDLWVCGFHCGLSVRGIVRVRAMGVPSVLSFCSPMVHRPKLLCWDKRLWQRINEFIENKCVFILGFQSEIWNDVAMKLLFSRINEERKCTISLQQGSVCLAGKREGVHFVPNPFDWGQKWDLWSDLQWIPHWTHLFGAFGRLWMRGQSCRELKIS